MTAINLRILHIDLYFQQKKVIFEFLQCHRLLLFLDMPLNIAEFLKHADL